MMAMYSRPLFPRTFMPYVTDSPLFMTTPLIILSFAAIKFGYFSSEAFLSAGSTFYINSIFTHPNVHTFLFDASFGSSLLSFLPITFLFLFIFILFINPFSSNHNIHRPSVLYPIRSQFNFTTHFGILNYFGVFYHWVMFYVFVLSNFFYRYIDKGFLEFFGPLGILKFLHYLGFLIELLSTGFIPHYAYILIFSILFFCGA